MYITQCVKKTTLFMHAIKVLCFMQRRQECKTRKNKISVYFVTSSVILILSDFCCLSYLLHTIKVHLLTALSDYADQLFILEYKMYKLFNNRASIMGLINIHV